MRRYFAGALLAAVVVAGLVPAIVFRTGKSLASPGALSSPHASLDKSCGSCHAPRVATARCEHCHDPFATGRLNNAAHVWLSAKDARAASRASRLECSSCHTDHRGRAFPIAAADDRQCRACHFASLRSHPEFALVKAGVQKEEGLQFSHKKHLKAVRKAKLDDCLYCHEPSPDRRGFVPINFDQQCSRCHLPRGFVGDTDPVLAKSVALPQDIDAAWARTRSPVVKNDSGAVVVTRLAHKDPWVLYNQVRLASQLDPNAAVERKKRLERRAEELTARLAEQGKPALTPAALKVEEARLAREAATAAPGSVDRSRVERALERVRVEVELGPAPMAAVRRRSRIAIEAELGGIRENLANLTAVAAGQALSPEGKQARLDALAAITAPCALCHVFDAGWMNPVAVPASALARARFSHLPHLQQMNCAKCHSQIEESKKAENVNLPGVRFCESCHRAGRNRTDCAECHSYHPQAEPWPPI
jgi:hypothetical protein